jgi:hypothetical protein
MSNPAPSRPLSPTFFPSLAFLLFGVALALGFVTATDKFGRSLTQIRQNRPEIVVKGVATQDLRSAQGMVGADLAWRGENHDAGRDAMLAQRTQLTASLRKAGFAENEIIFEATTVRRLEPAVYLEPPLAAGEKQPVRGRQLIDFDTHARGQVPEYVFAQHLTLQSADVARIEAFSRQEFFPSGGVTFVRSTPIFRLLNLADVKKDLLESAAKDAQRRAQTMVNGSGSRLGSLLEAAQGVIQISAKDRIDESDSGNVDVFSIDKTIRVVVTMRFELVKE